MSTAQKWAGWLQRSGRFGLVPTVGTPGASRAGVPFLQDVLSDARILVEVAWGANPLGSTAVWSWQDITRDVRQTGGSRINIRIGRSDEAATSQPANCTMMLNNRSGNYSQGAESVNYPNVQRNVPLRVSIDPNGTGFVVIFQGNVTSFTPQWDISGADATVSLTASGALRRLAQGKSPILSSIKRSYLKEAPTPIAYWPCEDGVASSTIASGLPFGASMTFTGTPVFASNSSFYTSAPILKLNGASLSGIVAPSPNPGEVYFRWLNAFPNDTSIADGTILAQAFLTGTAARWEVIYRTASNGSLTLNVYDNFGVSIFAGGTAAVTNILTGVQGLNNTTCRLGIEMTQSGADVNYSLSVIFTNPAAAAAAATAFAGTITGRTVGVAGLVRIAPNKDITNLHVGHITVQDIQPAFAIFQGELNGKPNEFPVSRLRRLCQENSVPFSTVGVGSTEYMGPQLVKTLVDVLRESETQDQGILYDGVGPGLTYASRSVKENASPALTLDVANHDLSTPLVPIDDDMGVVNSMTVTRALGTSVQYADSTGVLGTNAIGIYDSSVTVSLQTEARLNDYASWFVHMGTRPGYRYPSISLSVRRRPQFLVSLLGLALGSRVDVINSGLGRVDRANETISLTTEGYSFSIDQFNLDVQINCSSYELWRIGVLAADTGDLTENVMRLDTDGSALVSLLSPGDSTMLVATPSGPLWTTAADDFPLTANVGGISVIVSSIAGSSSPQTFTITPTTFGRPGGSTVELRKNTVLGL